MDCPVVQGALPRELSGAYMVGSWGAKGGEGKARAKEGWEGCASDELAVRWKEEGGCAHPTS